MADGYQWAYGDGDTGSGSQSAHTYAEPGVYTTCLSTWWYIDGTQDSCWVESCQEVTIGGEDPCVGLEAGFSWATTTPNGFQFSNGTSGTGGSTQWFWSFGDNTGSNQAQPSHTYAQPGLYEVCLTAISIYELPDEFVTCEDTHCIFIQVGVDPCEDVEACILVNDLGNNAFLFENCSSPIQNAQFVWDLGDGTLSTDLIVDHSYAAPGTYTICLSIFWENCQDSTCTTITVIGDPCDELNAGFFQTTGPNGTQFSNATTGTGIGTLFYWDLGDGAISYDAQPFHTYAQAGSYEVCLEVLTMFEQQNGSLLTCLDTTCAIVEIGGGGPCSELTADFTFSGDLGMNFANAVINNTWSYFWDFGDGTFGNGPNPFHNYSESGSYEVCLTVWTWDPIAQDTCFADNCEMIIVGGGDPCDFLQACFVPSPSGTIVFFNNCTPNEQGTQFMWDFGDGATSDAVAPTHTYSEPGVYTVCLMAEWENCSDSTCVTITVAGGNPCDELNAEFEGSSAGLGVNFANAVINNTWSYFWDFGDGTNGNGPDPFHSYSEAGSYEVCLTVWTWDPVAQDTCFADNCELIVVGGGDPCDFLQACFVPSPSGTSVFFNNCTPNEQGTQYMWDFGDGATSDAVAPTHTYAEPGVYTVCLMAEWENCSDSTCVAITVGSGPGCEGYTAWFEVEYQNNAVVFFGHSSVPNSSMFWSFGDGSTGVGNVVTQLYEPPGPFEVCLEAWYYNEMEQDTCFAQSCQLIDPFGTVGIVDPNSRDTFNIYPQPAHDQLMITGSTLKEGSVIRLIGMDGRIELQTRASGPVHTMDLSGIAPAVHVLQVNVDGQRYNYRVVIE